MDLRVFVGIHDRMFILSSLWVDASFRGNTSFYKLYLFQNGDHLPLFRAIRLSTIALSISLTIFLTLFAVLLESFQPQNIILQ